MTDIVERLRGKVPMAWGDEGFMITDDDTVLATFKEAADEIERLRAALSVLANKDNWSDCGQWTQSWDLGTPWEFASTALEGE